MKNLISPLDAGLAPLYKEGLLNVQDQAQLGIFSIIAAFADASEGGIIVSGLDVASINTGASTIVLNPGYVALNGKLIAAPSGYSGSYPFYISEGSTLVTNETWKDGNPHPYYATSVCNFTTTDPGAVQKILFNPFSSQYLPLVIKRKSKEVGEIIPFAGSPNQSGIALFSGTGLGLFKWKGFAFANGQNGTVDLRGKFLAGQDTGDSDYASIGSTGGEKRHQLTVSEIPNLPITGRKTAYSGGGSNMTVLETDFAGTVTADDKATKGVSGLPTAHENRPPFYTVAYLQRI